MKKSDKIPFLILIGFTVLAAAFFFIFIWNRPLGVSLSLPTRTPIIENITSSGGSTPMSFETGDDPTQESPLPSSTPTLDAPDTVCGGPPVMYILGIGVDTRDMTYLYGLADVIRVVRVDFVDPKITVLTLPRDLWVELPDIIDKYADTVTHGKLNQAYLYGGPGMGYYNGSGGGPGLLAHTIAHNYGLYVDNYGAINMYAFERMIDALGGIDIYLEQDWDGRPVDEHTIDLGYFTAGQHHMSGSEALRFARIRKKYSEVDRTDNQSLVICAVKEKVLRPGVIGSIPELINSLSGMVQTDLTPAQISQLTCLLPKLGPDDLQFVRFPDEMMVQGSVYDPNLGDTTFVWDIPVEDIQQFIRDFENDAIPADSDAGMSCP
jgi:LCP family protein required for cell wall assembly